MKRKTVAVIAGVIAVAAICLNGFPVIAETAAPKKTEVAGTVLKQLASGTVFTFARDKGKPLNVKIKKMEGVFITQEIRESSSENVGFGVTLSGDESMDDSDRKKVVQLFPLKVGNTVSIEHSGTSSRGYKYTASDTMKVTGMEKVTVPAGTFETFVIDTKMSSEGWEGHNICWYSPDIGYCVKRQWRSTRNNSDWELVSVAAP